MHAFHNALCVLISRAHNRWNVRVVDTRYRGDGGWSHSARFDHIHLPVACQKDGLLAFVPGEFLNFDRELGSTPFAGVGIFSND